MAPVKLSASVSRRVQQFDWRALERALTENGYAQTGPLLTAEECRELITLYPDDARFRSHIDMARFRFGLGDYKYFADPLPETIQELRASLYPPLAQIANRWMENLGSRERFPAQIEEFLKICHRHGQKRPTPLLLRYSAGGYNCLHQDIYGEVAFPLQVACFLSEPGRDYTGGEFLLMEQRPRAQSKGQVITPQQGEAVIFTTRYRSVRGSRGYYRVNIRHGVSTVKSGERYTLGIIFHDAK
ncbi:MAG TPA: 2OG-Fe(II) oxygenase [Terriglobales bacterium]|nr:2OG-Fe(II) oxygenase [Terriglobales bacterium]